MILAIEAAIRGGSVALIRDDRDMASWHGTEVVSRAEDLLANIADLLAQNHIDKRSLDMIAVSNGPGSYTGIRIGIATALGLAKALNIECIGVPLLEAMAKKQRRRPNCIVAVPIGRNELCWQTFRGAGDFIDPPSTGSVHDFTRHSIEFADMDILLQRDAYKAVAGTAEFSRLAARTFDCGRDLATAIGLASRDNSSDMNPNYVRNSQFSSNPL